MKPGPSRAVRKGPVGSERVDEGVDRLDCFKAERVSDMFRLRRSVLGGPHEHYKRRRCALELRSPSCYTRHVR